MAKMFQDKRNEHNALRMKYNEDLKVVELPKFDQDVGVPLPR